MVLTDDGHVYSWGAGKEGQLGHGDQVQQLTEFDSTTKGITSCMMPRHDWVPSHALG